MTPFRKRTFSLPLLARSLTTAILHLPLLIIALIQPATSRALREKVMLAVTDVNDCQYCRSVHTGLARANGVDLDELRHVFDEGTFDKVDSRDVTAILFARHFADTVRRPTVYASAALALAYTAYQRAEIMAYIHGIYFTNLGGNSFDAWLARFAGMKVETGHPVAEAIAAVFAAPSVALLKLCGGASFRNQPEAAKRLK